MDPFAATIIKQSLLIFGGIAILGLFIAAGYGLCQYGKLQYAMTLNMIPRRSPDLPLESPVTRWPGFRMSGSQPVHRVVVRGVAVYRTSTRLGAPVTAQEHFRRAEELAAKAAEYLGREDGQESAAVWAALAQVHASLALAAAILLNPEGRQQGASSWVHLPPL